MQCNAMPTLAFPEFARRGLSSSTNTVSSVVCGRGVVTNRRATVYAIVNDRLSVLELAITSDMGHDGWANYDTLSNIHERSLYTSRFHLYKNTKVSMETP